MISKRITAALAGATSLSLVLVACGNNGGDASSSSSGDTVKSLSILDYYNNDPDKSLVQKGLDSCASQLGVTIQRETVPGDTLIQKVLQQASSKTLPDVLMLDNPDVQQIASSGALTPLSDYGITGKGVEQEVLAAGTLNGKLYGLAPGVNSLALFYNKDMFAAAGLTPPTTWAELASDAKKLSGNGKYGFAFAGTNTYEGSWQFMPWMWSNGGTETQLNSPQNAQALDFLASLVKDGSVSASVVGWGQGDALNQFIAGKAAMMENDPWNIPALKAVKGLNFGYVPIPASTAGKKSQAPLGGETFTVPNTGNTAKEAAAGKIVACINSPKNENTIAAENNYIPSNPTIAAAFGKSNPDLAPFVSIVADARSRTGLLGTKWPTVGTEIYQAEQLALTGKATGAAALAQVAANG
jgi:multiple sugar transport system substrate-binding protein